MGNYVKCGSGGRTEGRVEDVTLRSSLKLETPPSKSMRFGFTAETAERLLNRLLEHVANHSELTGTGKDSLTIYCFSISVGAI